MHSVYTVQLYTTPAPTISVKFMWWSALGPKFGESPIFLMVQVKSSLFQQNAWKIIRRSVQPEMF